jgi:hypothetical protein
MPRPPMNHEPGANLSPEELLDELQQRPGAGEEDIEQDFSGEEDAGHEEPDVSDQPSEADEPDRQGRRSPGQRLRELRDQARAEADRAANAERELYALRMQQEAQARERQQYQEQQREEQNLENMPFDQQVEWKLRRAEENNKRQYQQMQFQNVVNQDKAEYMAKCAGDPDRRRLAAKVEQTYFQAINTGRYIPRDEVYFWALGKEIEEQRQAQQGKRRVTTPGAQAQRVRAPGPRSDQETSRSRGGGRANETLASRERKLENIRF